MTDAILLSLDESHVRGDRPAATDPEVEYALDRAEQTGAALHALFVVDTGRYGEPALSSAEILVDDVEDAAHDLLTTVAGRGRRRGVTVVTRCCHGRPNEELTAYAAEVGADTVVLAGGRRPGRVRAELRRIAGRVVTPGTAVER
jgi:nucleotide-binding universal stress UspA family protein